VERILANRNKDKPEKRVEKAPRDLERFVKAQERTFDKAMEEMKSGAKWGHWMWFIFPQLLGLGHSEIAQFYGIRDMKEAKDYLRHPVLGRRLVDICRVVLLYEGNDATLIFGYPDNLKLQSCMTLFHRAAPEVKIFQAVLAKFFGGNEDYKTLEMLGIDPRVRPLEVKI